MSESMFAILRSLLCWLLAPLCTSFIFCAVAAAQSNAPLHTGHAIPGLFGFESNARPPRGFSFENTTLVYHAAKESDHNGLNTGNPGHVRHISNHSTVSWLSPWRLFGANYVARFRLSVVNSAPQPRSLESGNTSVKIGDTYIEPLALYWLGKSGSISLRYGIWWDTGQFDASSMDNAGKGFTTQQFSLGFNYYPQKDRRWNFSVLGRYGRHSNMEGLDLKPGQDIVVDWSAGRKFAQNWNAGFVGYGVFQTTRDKGADANVSIGFYGTAAAGMGVSYKMPPLGGSAQLRVYQEFNSFNHTEGQTVAFGVHFTI